jgi:hypothetical protein
MRLEEAEAAAKDPIASAPIFVVRVKSGLNRWLLQRARAGMISSRRVHVFIYPRVVDDTEPWPE